MGFHKPQLYMTQADTLIDHELNWFVLFLENNDAKSWNALRADLSAIYLAASGEDEFLSKAVFRVATFVERWRATYWAKYAVNRDYFFTRHQSFVAAASMRIAYSEMQEFKLGNFS